MVHSPCGGFFHRRGRVGFELTLPAPAGPMTRTPNLLMLTIQNRICELDDYKIEALLNSMICLPDVDPNLTQYTRVRAKFVPESGLPSIRL